LNYLAVAVRTLSALGISGALLLSLPVASAAEELDTPVVIIDVQKNLKTLPGPPIGENLNFLMSSDSKWPRKVSNKSRIKEMNLGILRFPYGHLGDNYLFTDAPFTDGDSGLTPRVASMKVAPGSQGWPVDDKGYFTRALDFDEFMGYVKTLNIEPLIMVNMLAYDKKHYPETTVTFDDLKAHAVEWVRYANITRGHNIKYWQLGNEVAIHADKESYIRNFVAVAKAMKEVDPSILTGFGEDGRREWVREALADDEVSHYIDFLSPHQYLFGRRWTESYQDWRDYSGKLDSKIAKFQQYANNSKSHKDVPLIITEYGVTGGDYPENDPHGYHVLKPLSGRKSSSAVVALSPDGKQLTNIYKGPNQRALIYAQLLKDGWFLLRPALCGTCFITAPQNRGDPIHVSDTPIQASMWRILESKREEYLLASKSFPDHYVVFDEENKRYVLSETSEAQAQRFQFVARDHKGSKASEPDAYQQADKRRNYGNDLWKSLVFAELSLSSFQYKNVKYMIHWNTHTSWDGEFGGYLDTSNALQNTEGNELTPIGQVIKLINNNTYENVLNVAPNQGRLRVYATANDSGDQLSVIVLNKNDKEETITLELSGFAPEAEHQRIVYSGKHPEDESPMTNRDSKKGATEFGETSVHTSLAPLSLTILRFTKSR
jgi:alpha-L-arabinofuranosidase